MSFQVGDVIEFKKEKGPPHQIQMEMFEATKGFQYIVGHIHSENFLNLKKPKNYNYGHVTVSIRLLTK